MKKITLFFTSLLFVFIVNAQEKILSYYLGPVVSVPTSDFGQVAGMGFGGEFQVDYPFGKHIDGFAQGGFQSFSVKNLNGHKYTAFSTPTFLLGSRYNFNKFSFGLGIGYNSYLSRYTEDGVSIDPQIGFKINNFNIIAHYNVTYVSGAAFTSSHFNFFGLKLFYRLSDIFENPKF